MSTSNAKRESLWASHREAQIPMHKDLCTGRCKFGVYKYITSKYNPHYAGFIKVFCRLARKLFWEFEDTCPHKAERQYSTQAEYVQKLADITAFENSRMT
jgi:hypothetical protein